MENGTNKVMNVYGVWGRGEGGGRPYTEPD